MFDKFEPLQILKKMEFTFNPSRYEVWIGGQMIKNGRTNSILAANIIKIDSKEKIEINFVDDNLIYELSTKNIFDEFVSAKDRLQLIIVPAITNNENIGIIGFRNIYGSTCEKKFFNRNEPYCCNLFLQNGYIAKVTFSYSNPEKLLELYI